MRGTHLTVIAVTTLGLAAGCGDDGSAPSPDGPAIDAPAIDAPAIDAPAIDAPTGPIALHLGVAGTGAGIIRAAGSYERCATASCVFEPSANQSFTLTQRPIAGSTFDGWSGCTANPDGTCTVVVNGTVTVTASYTAPPPVTWVRSSSWMNLTLKPVRLTATGDGVMASGTGYFFIGSGGAWLGRYLADGTAAADFLDDPTSLHDHELATAVGLGGDIWVLLALSPATPQGSERLALHRLTPTGTRVFEVLPGGSVGSHGLALDAAGNAYVSGVDGTTPFLVSYDPAGAQRWRVTPASPSAVHALALRGDVLVAAASGWLGTYDLAGAPGWTRTIAPTTVVIADLAVDSDGDVIYGGVDNGAGYVAGAVTADGATAPWQTTFASRSAGALALRADDRVRLWLGSAANSGGPSSLVDLDENGVQTASETVTALPTPGGIVIDASGATFLAGPDHAAEHPAILRRP